MLLLAICVPMATAGGSMGSWIPIANMSLPLVYASAASLNGKLYVVGGEVSQLGPKIDRMLATGAVFDPLSNSWSPIANMSVARVQPGVAALDGKVYALGGYSITQTLRSGEAFDRQTGLWAGIADMSVNRAGSSAVALNGQIYVIGGNGLKSGEVYDPVTDSWSAVADMSVVRANTGGAALNGKIYVVGGWDGDKRTESGEVYDPATNSWSVIPPMATSQNAAQQGHANAPKAVALDGKLYVVGGSPFMDTPTAAVSYFDPLTGVWTPVADLTTERSGPCAATINGKIYVAGGHKEGGLTGDRIGPMDTAEVFTPPALASARYGDSPTRFWDLFIGVVAAASVLSFGVGCGCGLRSGCTKNKSPEVFRNLELTKVGRE
jgi:N-acetylneuraminic acid mutarotase